MKRIGNLYGKIISAENLWLADERARRGKRETYGVSIHDRTRARNIRQLHEVLKNKEFKTSPYSTFVVYEPKKREIARLPYFPDRIMHHAIMNILEPIWTPLFTSDTYACIKNRGIHLCASSLRETLKQDPEGTQYCLKLDIRKFYPSVDHDILKEIVRRKIKCADTLALLDEIIDSAEGIPIGNYLSQYFANLYLAYFDHWLKESRGVKYYFRYFDDMVFPHGNKPYLHELREHIRIYLMENLRLELKSNWQVFPVEKRGIDFVGYVFFHTHTRMRKGIKQNFCRAADRARRMGLSAGKSRKLFAGWYGWAKHCNAANLIRKIAPELRKGKNKRNRK